MPNPRGDMLNEPAARFSLLICFSFHKIGEIMSRIMLAMKWTRLIDAGRNSVLAIASAG
jgi:hypothetical protein